MNTQKIKQLESQIKELERTLPYACGQNFYKQRGEIFNIHQEINQIQEDTYCDTQGVSGDVTTPAQACPSFHSEPEPVIDFSEWLADSGIPM